MVQLVIRLVHAVVDVVDPGGAVLLDPPVRVEVVTAGQDDQRAEELPEAELHNSILSSFDRRKVKRWLSFRADGSTLRDLHGEGGYMAVHGESAVELTLDYSFE